MYGIGMILGAGIYVLIGEAAGIAGNTLWVSFVIGAVAATFTGLSYAELSSMFPKSAAEFIYVRKAFNNEFLAFLVGWLLIFTSIVSASTLSLGFGSYFAGLFGSGIALSAVLLIIMLSFVIFYGIRESSWMNILFTMIEAGGLLLIIYIGFTFPRNDPVNYFESPFGIFGIVTAVPLIFFAYVGFDNIVNIAEEIKNPTKVLPKAILLSIMITAVVYFLVSLAAIRVLDWQELGESVAPLAAVAGKALGSVGYSLLSAIALFSITNTVLISLVTGSRIIYGMAAQGSLPSLLSNIHFKTRTPWVATLVVMVAAVTFVFTGDMVTIANITVLSIVIIFVLVNAALLRLRYTEPNVERPFKVPLNIGKFPVLPFLGLITSLAGIILFEAPVLAVGIIVISLGALFHILSQNHR
jgi:APA family basic amino acid/polyamine antiporter